MLKSQFDNITTLESGSMQTLGKVMTPDAVDIVIIGLSEEQPDIDRALLEKTMKKNPFASFIVYASTPDQKLARSLIRMGVRGYLTKHACAEELVTCVRSILSGNPYLSPQILIARLAQTRGLEV